MRPTQVGNYELIRLLGVGGMAETYEAVRHGPAGFSQRVCLKRMLAQNLDVDSAVELFLDEARLSALLRCGSIAQVIDFGEADGSYYIALELVDGENLETLLREHVAAGRRFSWPVVSYLAAELLSALDYAHNLSEDGQPLGIVHRDVSPSNVMVSLRGEVKLTDFGIAKARGRKHRTRSGHTKGKLAYMSPEQARGESLDGRSDLFSLGILLYELMTLRHPFEATTEIELLHNIVEAKFVPLERVVPDAPGELRVLVERMLRADPRARIASAEAALAGLSFSASPYVVQGELAHIVSAQREGRRGEARASRPVSGAPSRTLELAATAHAVDTRPPPGAGYSSAHTTAGDRAGWRGRRSLVAVAMVVLGVVAAGAFAALRPRDPEEVTATPPMAASPAASPAIEPARKGAITEPAPSPAPFVTQPQAPGPDASIASPTPAPERRATPARESGKKRNTGGAAKPATLPKPSPQPQAQPQTTKDSSRSGVKVTPEEFL